MVFASTLFIKCILLHYISFGYIAVRSLWNEPQEFFSFYIIKLLPAVGIASLVFLTKRKWWTVVVSLLVDIWIVANAIYVRSYGLFLTLDVIAMAGNLSGFTSSILAYVNWKVLIFFGITMMFAIFVWNIRITKRNYHLFLCAFLLTGALVLLEKLTYTGKVFPTHEPRLVQIQKIATGKSSASMSHYVESSSILHYFPTIFIYDAYHTAYLKDATQSISFTEREQEILQTIIRDEGTDTPTSSLYILLVESLENWAIGLQDTNGMPVMPFLASLIKEQNVLYAKQIRSQALYGNSGDGQMLVNTGMLPVQSGAACMLYGKHTFPNIGHFYNNTLNVNAASNNVWNQYDMNHCYAYNHYVFPQGKIEINDAEVFNLAKQNLPQSDEKICVQVITISTHVPFHPIGSCSLQFEADMPETMQRYLVCAHYTDSCIADFVATLQKRNVYENASIVITGDHTIFKKSLLQEFQPFAQKYHYPVPDEESFCPLIIVSSNLSNRVEINEMCYQMDIFPTILHCIGVDDYYWKGFGVNLLDSTARKNRLISEEEAFTLSDKMIRSNYFAK